MKDILINRRKSVRIKGDFTLELGSGQKLKLGQTIDINLRGMCCEIEGSVPIFEVIQIRIQIPITKKEKEILNCQGVVVRIEPTSVKGVSRMAFYFTGWDPLSKERMKRFLKNFQFSEAA